MGELVYHYVVNLGVTKNHAERSQPRRPKRSRSRDSGSVAIGYKVPTHRIMNCPLFRSSSPEYDKMKKQAMGTRKKKRLDAPNSLTELIRSFRGK